ncbi:AfsR/SARP family transcriptional regulator [Kitasatospora aureofaciens]|uniref:AfsR/SARP family transcriptional regulator n=1 Tax=Kitasatospora aureofaciens TaxID=1894 RepID=UPI001C45D1E7|nr:AfsR/SARP family transcriptional regulator [Kitasatospora aureofaciens]MBV6696692.1 AfsR/SARP family transcriptional regulator [Kitasatospora aureofaciens]
MDYSVLGTLAARDGEIDRTPSAPKLRRVLATLLLRANKLVLAETLAEELWQDNPPSSATATLQTYIYQLRKSFGSDARSRESIIRTRTEPSGYVLSADPDHLDLVRFQILVREGRRALETNRPHQASSVLREALDLWQGPVFGGVVCGPVLQSHATFLEEERMNALEMRIDADLQLGQHRELVSELKTLVVAHPLHEWFHSRLMTALHWSSRQGEALDVYQCYRRRLRDELGLEPGLEMQRAQQDILNAGHPQQHAAVGLLTR